MVGLSAAEPGSVVVAAAVVVEEGPDPACVVVVRVVVSVVRLVPPPFCVCVTTTVTTMVDWLGWLDMMSVDVVVDVVAGWLAGGDGALRTPDVVGTEELVLREVK